MIGRAEFSLRLDTRETCQLLVTSEFKDMKSSPTFNRERPSTSPSKNVTVLNSQLDLGQFATCPV